MSTIASFYTDQISNDLDWRETELAIFRKQVFQTKIGSIQEKTFLRAAVAMTYAHYEGFCKFALASYIDALSKLGLKRKDLKWALVADSLDRFAQDLRNTPNSSSLFAKLLDEFNATLDEAPEFQRPDNIANLWPDLLITWLDRFALNTANVSSHATSLHSLVVNRNQIAHGKKLAIDTRESWDDFLNSAMLAMHEVAIEVTDALANKSYRRHAHVMTIFGHAT